MTPRSFAPDEPISGVEPVDRLIRVAVRLQAKGDAAAADRAFRAARRAWDDQPPVGTSPSADLEGIRGGLFKLRDEDDLSSS